MSDDQPTPPYESLSYEEARDQLTRIVTELDAGGQTLEQSLSLWEQGQALAKRCEDLLDNAWQRLEASSQDLQKDE